MVVQQNHTKRKRFQLIYWLKITSCELIERQTKLGKYVKKLIKWQYLLVIGYMWCMIGYISLNMVKSQFTNTWQVNIEPEHSFQRRWRELAAIKLVFFKWFGLYCNTDCWFYCSNDCYWFEDLSVSKASKAESAIPPVDCWEYVGPQFSLFSWSELPDVKKWDQ